MRNVIVTVALILACGCASPAEDGDAGSGWGKITELYVDAKVSVLRLDFSQPIVNPAKCEGADFYVLELDDSVASDRFLRTVVDAYLADREVKFWIDGCSKSQWWGKTRPQIFDIYIGR